MIIACDFDDVLCSRNPEPGYRMGVPEPGAVSSVQRLVNQGHTIIIFTARNVQEPRAHKAVSDWLDYFGIPYSGISNIKSPSYDVFIDNKAIGFRSWPQTMVSLKKLESQVQNKPANTRAG